MLNKRVRNAKRINRKRETRSLSDQDLSVYFSLFSKNKEIKFQRKKFKFDPFSGSLREYF